MTACISNASFGGNQKKGILVKYMHTGIFRVGGLLDRNVAETMTTIVVFFYCDTLGERRDNNK